MTTPENDDIVIVDGLLESLKAGIPGDPGAPGLDQLKDEYSRLLAIRSYHEQEASRCTVTAGYKLNTAMSRMRNAGLTWDQIREELKSWH
jgi:hypothetical protein